MEVVLFGDDPGAAEICAELGLHHEPHVERNEVGTKRLDYMFGRAQQIARHALICYVNCDIVLLSDFCSALERVSASHSQFLMVGRRWDTDILDRIDLSTVGAMQRLRDLALQKGVQRGPDCVDYFAFPRGLYKDLPPLVVGRIWWDHFLVWRAVRLGAHVVDASSCVVAIHQNHDYAYHPGGAIGVWNDEQAQQNYKLAGGKWHLYTIADATHILEPAAERPNRSRLWAPYWRFLRPKIAPSWLFLLNATRPVRHRLGLKQETLARQRRREG